ncbi:MAG: rhomboid family intramembrane serine protease [Pirellulales bacterium]
MRQIGTLSDPQQAQRFADYLLTQGITTRLDPHDGVVNVWVREEDQVPRAVAELASFQREPNDDRYQAAAPEAQALRREAQRREKQFRRNLIDVRRRWSGAGVSGRRPVTNALIGISVIVAVLTYGGNGLASYLYISNIIPPQPSIGTLTEVWHGQLWRLVTPIFMHGDFLHLIFNMLWLHQLGPQIEGRRGSGRFLALVLAIAVISNVAQYLAQGPALRGMSGVVFGLFGYIWMKSRFEASSGFVMHPQTIVFMLLWAALCMSGMVGDIANWAHGVGLAVGMAMGYAPVAWRNLTRRR